MQARTAACHRITPTGGADAVLIVAGLLRASLLSRRVRKVLKFARKFLAGHPLNGYHRTNATFTRGATKVLDPRGRAHPWHWRPG